MKLATVRIENYRSIRELEFEFPESGLLVLVGANNAGKSNIIRAVDALCGEAWYGREKVEPFDHYMRDPERRISINLDFDNGWRAGWSSNAQWPEYKDSHGDKLYQRKLKDDFPCTYLGADRTLDRHVAFHEWTLLSKIKRHFHKKARSIETELQDKYEQIIKLFDEVEGFRDFAAGFEEKFASLQADTPAKLSLGFKPYTPSNYFKTLQILTQDPQQADEAISLDELGEGSRNTVLLALLWSYAVDFKGAGSGVLALEEPELFLHPHARRHLFKALREITATGHQVIISTHSSSFVDTELFDSIGRVIKVPDEEYKDRRHTQLRLVSKAELVKHCVETGVPANKVTEGNIAPFYRVTASSTLNEAFFARYLVLVEGETEELALPIFLGNMGLDCNLLGVSVLGLGGKNQIPRYWRLFGRFALGMVVLFDNDESGEKNSNKNVATCMGIDEESIVSDVDIFKTMNAARSPASLLVVLENDYESALKKDYSRWVENTAHDPEAINTFEREARELIQPQGSQGKGLIARHVARRLTETIPDYIPAFVDPIAEKLAMFLKVSLTRRRADDDGSIPF
jgi:putative ATP-dependent endonuclease of OLD family